MRSISQMIAASAACIAITVVALYAVSGERPEDVTAIPVVQKTQAALPPIQAETFAEPIAPVALTAVPIEDGFLPEISASFETVIIEPAPSTARTVTLDATQPPEVDWPTSTENSMSAYRKTKIDRDVYRSIERKN
jgi:hypothetical protein